MLKSISVNKRWFFLAAASVVGMGLAWLATLKYGAGLAGDSMHYLSVAANLLAGRGFYDFAGNGLILFPPLFPLLIAGLARLLRADAFAVGWVLNLLLWGLNIWLSGVFFMRVFRERPVYFYLCTLIVLLSTSALAMHASILSDPLFLSITLLFFLAGESYIRKPNWGPLLGMFGLALLAPLLRYSGFAQIVSGGLIILYAHGRNLLKSLPLAGAFGALSLLPIALWIYLHNYLPHGTWWGTNNAYGADVPVNLLQALRKMMYWFVPYRPLSQNGFVEPVLALGAALIVLVLINKREDWRAWLAELTRPLLVSTLVLTAVYFGSTILNIQTLDHKALFSDRYFVIIQAPVLALILITFDRLVLPHIPLPPRVLKLGLLALFGLWLLYPLYKDYKYLQASLANGEAGYNQYNTRAFHESALIAGVFKLVQQSPATVVYSNIPPAVWFYTGHTTLLPPAQDVPRSKDEIKATFAGWPGRSGYYAWFEPDPFELFMPLKDLSLVANMEVVEKFSDGIIVWVWPRGSP